MKESQVRKCAIPNDSFFALADEFLAEGKGIILTCRGNSMLPFIRHEVDNVEIHPADGSIKVGDIILATLGEPERHILHRVIGTDPEGYTLMGDGNLKGTEWVRKEDVKGVVTAIIRKNGRRVIPSDGHVWRRLLPFRRLLLKLYRTFIFRHNHNGYN